MKSHDEALQILLTVRRRLVKHMAEVVLKNRDKLLNGQSSSANPLAAASDLAEIIARLAELDNAIAGLADIEDNDLLPEIATEPQEPQEPAETLETPRKEHLFRRFTELVADEKLEEASHELARTLQMPLDRVGTATRFFARATKTDPSHTATLAALATSAGKRADADLTKELIRTFGFQAVEAGMAMYALRALAGDEGRVTVNA